MKPSSGKYPARLEARVVKQEARGQWEMILTTLAPETKTAFERVGKHVPCPIHGGKDGYRVFNDVRDTGGGLCNTCGGHRDGFSHLMWLNEWSFKKTLEEVANVLGFESDASNTSSQAPKPSAKRDANLREEEQKRKANDIKLHKKLDKLWLSSVPLDDPSAEIARLYLARRGLGFDYALKSRSLRFNPAVPYYSSKDNKVEHLGDFPALIAMVCDARGRPCTIHRTYLTDGGYKAPVPTPKKLSPYPSNRIVTGGAIRLMPGNSSVIGYTEGLETALAVIEATDGLMPVWSAVSDTLLKGVQPPEGTKVVCLYGDQDRNRAGRNAVVEAKKRLWKDDIKVMGYLPDEPIPSYAKGVDWLDVLNHHGRDAVPFPDVLSERLMKEHS